MEYIQPKMGLANSQHFQFRSDTDIYSTAHGKYRWDIIMFNRQMTWQEYCPYHESHDFDTNPLNFGMKLTTFGVFLVKYRTSLYRTRHGIYRWYTEFASIWYKNMAKWGTFLDPQNVAKGVVSSHLFFGVVGDVNHMFRFMSPTCRGLSSKDVDRSQQSWIISPAIQQF